MRAIIPLPPYKNNAHDNGDTQSNDAWQDDDTPLIATIGRGYRSLLARYTDTPNQVKNLIVLNVYVLLLFIFNI